MRLADSPLAPEVRLLRNGKRAVPSGSVGKQRRQKEPPTQVKRRKLTGADCSGKDISCHHPPRLPCGKTPPACCTTSTDAAGAGLLEKAVFSKCRDRAVVRIVLTLRLVRNNVVLQAETFRQAEVAAVSGKTKPVQAGQENLPLDSPSGQTRDRRPDLSPPATDQLITTAGSAEFRRSRNGAEILLGAAKVRAALDAAQLQRQCPRKIDIAGHDRVKQHIRQVPSRFSSVWGVSDASGRVHDKKQPKFRRINRFLELIRDTESALPATGCLHICDLCCGKSYLSFAVYHYFTAIRHREVHGGRGHEGGRHGCLQ